MDSKNVLITGSNRGLGAEIALHFARHGYGVILHGRKNIPLEKVRSSISRISKNKPPEVVNGDLRSEEVLKDLCRIARKNDISVLVNNAGVLCPCLPLEKISRSKLEEILAVNLVSVIKLTKMVYEVFRKKKQGTVIMVNSFSGVEPHKLRSIYCASKWGLRGFSESFSQESARFNVRVLSVYPARIRTRKEFDAGMEAGLAAEKIFSAYLNKKQKVLFLGGK